ncbi:MAG: hypothetical protein JRJ17_06105 [Deltaproteobacteria bacterium]|nr:hypothetical protein [Deltaproteobacteria bacterium]
MGFDGGLRLKDGKVVNVGVRRGTVCQGKFAYGYFRIAVEDIRSITIHGEVSQEKKQP